MAVAKGFYGLFGTRDLQIPRKLDTEKYVEVKDPVIDANEKELNDWKSAEASKQIDQLFKGGAVSKTRRNLKKRIVKKLKRKPRKQIKKGKKKTKKTRKPIKRKPKKKQTRGKRR